MPFIYALCEPNVTEDIRYIGKANVVMSRYKSHRNEKRTTHKCRWIASLKSRGLVPVVRVVEEVSAENWQDAERHWIAYFRAAGCDLTNHTDGGEGLNGASEETRQKMSTVQRRLMSDPNHRQKVFTPERAANISASLYGVAKTPEHIAKLPQNHPGRKLSEEHKSKLRTNARGHRWSSNEVAALRERNRGNRYGVGNRSRVGQKPSETEKAKKSLALKGRPKSLEHREKIRQAQLTAWARRKALTNEGVLT